MGYLLTLRRLSYVILIELANSLLLILPFSILRVNFIRLLGGKIGAGTIIKRGVKLDFPWKLTIGKNCHISSSVYLDCRGGLIIIGNNSDISEQANIYTLSHDINSIYFCPKGKDINIGERVWICARSIVLPGSIIEDGCVIGANSVFSGHAESNALYQGVPCTKIKLLNIQRATQVRSER
ncbi:hypothetical protein LQR31_16885 [Chromobacterium vaccinii]|uniref:acyltransferase n=1 Tax=Chromobacterium vaccinii TaxID=1108595 RepID=UPI001E2BECFB|nr:hypothetical protein [Chromobacterium vaccinii]MCD4486149.1 hypothetical protein [Chromobacterium vaccinii]